MLSLQYTHTHTQIGGLPHWINEIPDMIVRANNTAWKKQMTRFFKDIVEISKPYLADNGGPIILSQVENEFRFQDPEYVNWCGDLVKELNVGIPFIMCNGFSANNTVNTLNGNDGDSYAEQHFTDYPDQPLAWTENEGWFQEWEAAPFSPHYDNRTAEDLSFVVAKWFARGGAHHNYYMWYGGNNYGRLAAGSCITNMYAAGTNILFDGLYNEPKKSHLKRLHDILAEYADSLLALPPQVNNKTVVMVLNTTTNKYVPATDQYAFVYSATGTSGIAFIESVQNIDVRVMFRNTYYTIPPYSVSLIDLTSKAVLFNSATVQTSGIPTRRVYMAVVEKLVWKTWPEPILTDSNMDYFIEGYPVEQLYITNDLTDYLFYQTTISGQGGKALVVKINSQVANSFVAFIDGIYQSRTDKCGKHYDLGSMTYNLQVDIPDNHEHKLTLLSISLGVGTLTHPGFYSLKGITDGVTLNDKDITEGQWIHRQYLQGELLEIYTEKGMDKVNWVNDSKSFNGMSPVWYMTTFDLPDIKPGYTLLLDLQGMGRGYFFLNGFNMGRYWLNVVGGEYVQRYYFLPQSMLKEKMNLLTLLEDVGANSPERVQLVQSTMIV